MRVKHDASRGAAEALALAASASAAVAGVHRDEFKVFRASLVSASLINSSHKSDKERPGAARARARGRGAALLRWRHAERLRLGVDVGPEVYQGLAAGGRLHRKESETEPSRPNRTY